MPEEHKAAEEHALIQEIAEPLQRLPDHPLDDIASPNFPVGLRGYDRGIVDAYVARVSQIVAELEATRVPEAAIRRALERVGEETSGILKRAHETAHELAARSRIEAEERLERARAEAQQIVSTAREGLKSLDEDTDRVWAERTKLLEDTRRLADDLLAVAERGLERFPPESEAVAPEDDAETQIMDAETQIMDSETHVLDPEAVRERDLPPDPKPTQPIEPPSAPVERAERDT
jgi:cell division septum initiation protein DivIVA